MANVEPAASALHVKTYRAAIGELVMGFNPTHFVTLAFNRSTTIDAARSKLRAFQARMDHALLGRNWLKRPAERTTYIAVIEHASSNLHLHVAFVVGDAHAAHFFQIASAIWVKLVVSGSVVVKPIYDAEGLGSYMAKEITPVTGDWLLTSDNG
jgi:hypothetical protein